MTRLDTRSVVGLQGYALDSARPSPQCPHIPFPNLSQNAEPCNLVNNRAHSDDYPIGQLQGTHRVSGMASLKVRENTNRQPPTTPPTINEPASDQLLLRFGKRHPSLHHLRPFLPLSPYTWATLVTRMEGYCLRDKGREKDYTVARIHNPVVSPLFCHHASSSSTLFSPQLFSNH